MAPFRNYDKHDGDPYDFGSRLKLRKSKYAPKFYFGIGSLDLKFDEDFESAIGRSVYRGMPPTKSREPILTLGAIRRYIRGMHVEVISLSPMFGGLGPPRRYWAPVPSLNPYTGLHIGESLLLILRAELFSS